jgi:molybdopterin synthase catalytic subunit
MIKVQRSTFDIKYAMQLLSKSTEIGAVVHFIGLVRDFNQGEHIQKIMLEHYPAMTKKVLQQLEKQAKSQWSIQKILIIHRYGTLHVNDPIVFVGVASKHREEAFDACRFLIDSLKHEAPFWKCEYTEAGPQWVASERQVSKNEVLKIKKESII